jgi:hypothetical protein
MPPVAVMKCDSGSTGQGLGLASISEARASACVSMYSWILVSLPSLYPGGSFHANKNNPASLQRFAFVGSGMEMEGREGGLLGGQEDGETCAGTTRPACAPNAN